ncbi:MAG: sodium-independent anion transporter [Bacteroidota bacterium]
MRAGPAIPDGIEVFEVHGSLFFGAVDQFTEAIRTVSKTPRVLILETGSLLSIDATGLRALEDLLKQLVHQGSHLVISGIHKQPLVAMTQSGVLDELGEDNVCGNLVEAIKRGEELLKTHS